MGASVRERRIIGRVTASYVLPESPTLPQGTVLTIYRAESVTGDGPTGAAVAGPVTMAAGGVTLMGLEFDRQYVAWSAVLRVGVGFRTEKTSGSVFPVALAAGEWAADGSRPWQEEWANHSAASHLRFTRSPFSPRGRGFYSLRTDLVDGDDGEIYLSRDNYSTQNPITNPNTGERAEVGMANPYDVARSRLHYEGDERWFSFGMYLPSAAELPLGGPFTFVAQWKQIGGVGGAPVLALDLRDATTAGARVAIRATHNVDPASAENYEAFHINMPREKWLRLTIRIKFHRTLGEVQVFGDRGSGGAIADLSGTLAIPTMKDPDTVSGGNLDLPNWNTVPISHTRLGLYRDPAIVGNAHIFHDGFTCAMSRATAEANAFLL